MVRACSERETLACSQLIAACSVQEAADVFLQLFSIFAEMDNVPNLAAEIWGVENVDMVGGHLRSLRVMGADCSAPGG